MDIVVALQQTVGSTVVCCYSRIIGRNLESYWDYKCKMHQDSFQCSTFVLVGFHYPTSGQTSRCCCGMYLKAQLHAGTFHVHLAPSSCNCSFIFLLVNTMNKVGTWTQDLSYNPYTLYHWVRLRWHHHHDTFKTYSCINPLLHPPCHSIGPIRHRTFVDCILLHWCLPSKALLWHPYHRSVSRAQRAIFL